MRGMPLKIPAWFGSLGGEIGPHPPTHNTDGVTSGAPFIGQDLFWPGSSERLGRPRPTPAPLRR